MFKPVENISFTHPGVLLVLTDRGILVYSIYFDYILVYT
jgi:hypothetical protein